MYLNSTTITIIISLVIVICFFTLGKKNSNNKNQDKDDDDIQEYKSRIISKHEDIVFGLYNDPNTDYYVVFQFDLGDKRTFKVKKDIYRNLLVGKYGRLKFKDDEYISFK